jgi:hypothetical protein
MFTTVSHNVPLYPWKIKSNKNMTHEFFQPFLPINKAVVPKAQKHWKFGGTASTHVAPFLHGFVAHSGTSCSQFRPAQPFAHVHKYANDEFCGQQVPPFRHVVVEHGLMTTSQFTPLNPAEKQISPNVDTTSRKLSNNNQVKVPGQ